MDNPVLTGGTNKYNEYIMKKYEIKDEYVLASWLHWFNPAGKVFDYRGRELVWDPRGNINLHPK